MFAQNTRKARLWRTTRQEIILREDLRDLSRIIEVGRIQILTALLPERVGAPFSVASMREDLGVFELHYLRNKDKHEIDFLITKDGTPWLPIEVKLHDAQHSDRLRARLETPRHR